MLFFSVIGMVACALEIHSCILKKQKGYKDREPKVKSEEEIANEIKDKFEAYKQASQAKRNKKRQPISNAPKAVAAQGRGNSSLSHLGNQSDNHVITPLTSNFSAQSRFDMGYSNVIVMPQKAMTQ
mmetsp:Transcript_16612/g.28298  ORF Transcript_16612/g.28298 Transcript_16612/m.28298 type:complete len:126 (-) Transcript_16612:546-923(-)